MGRVWWAITTVTTVGHGDSYPTTTSDRFIAIVVMLVGIGFVAILTAAAAERFVRARREESAELAGVRAQLSALIERLDVTSELSRPCHPLPWSGDGPSRLLA